MNWKIDDAKVWVVIVVLAAAAILTGIGKVSSSEAVVWVGSLVAALGLNSKEDKPSADKK